MSLSIKVMFYKGLTKLTKFIFTFVAIPKPTVFVGDKSTEQLCNMVAQFNLKRTLIVTDNILEELGLVAKVESALNEAGVNAVVYNGVTPDPTFTIVDETVSLLSQHNCDNIIALGGGSAIDAAKVAALCATNPNRDAKKLGGFFKAKHRGLPLFAIPTTAGTGSEVTIAAVVSDPITHAKAPVVDTKVVPLAAALDPTIMIGLPSPITAATGMDALTHAIESFLGKFATAETDSYALAAVTMIFNYLPRAYKNGEDIEAREAMALASFYAGLAFTQASVGYVHAIAHNFGAKYGTPHGLANAIVLPYILDYYQQDCNERLAMLSLTINPIKESIPVSAQLQSLTQAEKEVLAQQFINDVKQLNASMNIPKQLDALKEQDIRLIAKAALKEAHLQYTYPVPKYMDITTCESIIHQMLPSV
ncbi:iron-containing alcohol dehydrogenase [Flocculibacter collagenilyticus]|uniref:iron-containing alcohol dehydrogenase n=1 Tax=Flocculibacter collagenilyticus TaxID=2744479 RepID=UPI0018F3E7B8|nr:iron-containing alcohol dehydrogenase [Flocculibacter collagenilyticus]